MSSLNKIILLFILFIFGFLLLINFSYSTTNLSDIPVESHPRGIEINRIIDNAVVTNEKDDSVSIIDLNTETVLSKVLVGKFPRGCAVDNELNLALVGNSHDDTISLIDINNYQVVETISVGKEPKGVAINPLTHAALVANYQDNSVSYVDILNYTVLGTIPVGSEPIDISIDPELNLALVVNEKDYNVSVVDLNTFQVTGIVSVGKKPQAIDINPETHLAVVANEKDNSITIIDLLTLQTSTIPICKHPLDVAINQLDNRALVICDEDRSLLLIDLNTNTVISNYALNKLPQGIAVNNFTNIAANVDDKTDSVTLIQLPNPVPAISAITPYTVLRGTKGARIVINGSRFIKSSVVELLDTNHYTLIPDFIDNHSIEIEIPEEVLGTTGAYQITVKNPAPAGGTSNAYTLIVENPVPSISAIVPLETEAVTAGLTLTVYGTGFFDDTKAYINGTERPFALISNVKLEIELTEEDLEAGGYLEVTASNHAPGGGISEPATFTVLNPVPELSAIIPASIIAGSPEFTLNLTGHNFVKTSKISFNNQQYQSTYINKTQMEAKIPSSVIQIAGAYPVTVINPAPGGGATTPLTFTVKPPLEVKITSPVDGDTINKAKILVKGTIKSDTKDVGVTVNGIIAEIVGNELIANSIPLEIGSNTITAVATDAHGNTDTQTITVNVNEIIQKVQLSANITSGIPPLTTYFSVSTSVIPVTYQMDFDGDGVIDFSGDSFEDINHTFNTEGIFYPTVTVTDDQGNTYSDTIAVTVLNKEELDTLLKGKWENMKGRLANQDVEEALAYFLSSSQERYQYIFTNLFGLLPDIVTNMQAIEMISVDEGVAEYRIKKQESVGEVTYYIYFVLDKNGIWKILQI